MNEDRELFLTKGEKPGTYRVAEYVGVVNTKTNECKQGIQTYGADIFGFKKACHILSWFRMSLLGECDVSMTFREED